MDGRFSTESIGQWGIHERRTTVRSKGVNTFGDLEMTANFDVAEQHKEQL
jgi:hypothetical protein